MELKINKSDLCREIKVLNKPFMSDGRMSIQQSKEDVDVYRKSSTSSIEEKRISPLHTIWVNNYLKPTSSGLYCPSVRREH